VLESGGRSERPDLDPIVLLIEATLRRAGKGKRLVIENGAEAEVSPSLVAMIAEAFAIGRQHRGDERTLSILPAVILSDGDAVFQPRKVERSGLWAALDGRVLIYVHKERDYSGDHKDRK
jgi:hypothetical protein